MYKKLSIATPLLQNLDCREELNYIRCTLIDIYYSDPVKDQINDQINDLIRDVGLDEKISKRCL